MHARISDDNDLDPLELFSSIGTLIVEARVPGCGESGRGYGEGPHCPSYLNNGHSSHVCSSAALLCKRQENLRKHSNLLWQNGVPLCMEVLVGPDCHHGAKRTLQAEVSSVPDPDFLLLEKWTVSCTQRREAEATIPGVCLLQAVRSFLHFSQLSAWLNKSGGTRPQHLLYRLTMPGQAFGSRFNKLPVEHQFPVAYAGSFKSHIIKVSVSSYPRTDVIPCIRCAKCSSAKLGGRKDPQEDRGLRQVNKSLGDSLLDPPTERSRSRSGSRSVGVTDLMFPANRCPGSTPSRPLVDDRMQITCTRSGKHICGCSEDDMELSDANPKERGRSRKSRKDSITKTGSYSRLAEKDVKRTEILRENHKNDMTSRNVPSSDDKLRFQMSLSSAATLLFHSISSPSVPPKRCFNYLRSPPLRMTSAPLLGNFEESLLNGRLQPMSTVEGFRAELGASGSFCPSHQLLPVSVFFYSFGGVDTEKSASPYLAHVNLGPKGYQVPKRGTIQLTLFNPQGTVVKMFVVLYDLTEMPANSKSFLRQRTYFMPASMNDTSPGATKWLRYLIHLRFCSSKSGRLYLHTDVRMIILRKSDVDTASVLSLENSYEWKSFTRGPSNPRFSPR